MIKKHGWSSLPSPITPTASQASLRCLHRLFKAPSTSWSSGALSFRNKTRNGFQAPRSLPSLAMARASTQTTSWPGRMARSRQTSSLTTSTSKWLRPLMNRRFRLLTASAEVFTESHMTGKSTRSLGMLMDMCRLTRTNTCPQGLSFPCEQESANFVQWLFYLNLSLL